MVRLIVHRIDGTDLEIVAKDWHEAFAQVRDENTTGMEGETMEEEDWDEW